MASPITQRLTALVRLSGLLGVACIPTAHIQQAGVGPLAVRSNTQCDSKCIKKAYEIGTKWKDICPLAYCQGCDECHQLSSASNSLEKFYDDGPEPKMKERDVKPWEVHKRTITKTAACSQTACIKKA